MAPRKSARALSIETAQIFRRWGYDGASLSRLSKGTGLGRASLYHHFPAGKSEIAEAAYARIAANFTREVLAKLAGKGTPAERIMRMTDALDAFYDGGRAACFIDIFSIGDAAQVFADQLSGAVDYWIAAIATTLVEAGQNAQIAQARAQDAVIAIEGALVLARATGDAQVFARVIENLPRRLLAKTGS
ncbi:MAG: TetR/AcrR family transcriptional regulator [Alphaproteobacteria bacterium]